MEKSKFVAFWVLPKRKGWTVTVKRVCRLCNLEGLQMRLKPPRRRVMAKRRSDRGNATGPNQVRVKDWMYNNYSTTIRHAADLGADGDQHPEPRVLSDDCLSLGEGGGGHYGSRSGESADRSAARVPRRSGLSVHLEGARPPSRRQRGYDGSRPPRRAHRKRLHRVPGRHVSGRMPACQ